MSNRDPVKFQNLVFQLGQHPANLAILPLGQHDANPRAVPLFFQFADVLRFHFSIRKPDPGRQLLQIGHAGVTGHQGFIGFFDADARVHQLMGQVAVVGHQQQTFAGLVQSADSIDPLGHVGNQIEGPRSAGRVVIGAKVPGRFVHQPVDFALGFDNFVIDGDLLLIGVNLGAQFPSDDAIDAHAAAGDESVAMTREPAPA